MNGLSLARTALSQLGTVSFEPSQQADDLAFALAAIDNLGLLISLVEAHPHSPLAEIAVDQAQVRQAVGS